MNSKPFTITPALDAANVETIRVLFLEYASWLKIDLCFQGFDEELQALPGKYAPPMGRLYLAHVAGEPVGCIALRPFSPDTCEMKRLYVRDAARGLGVGRALAETVIADARAIGYRSMRLDTLPAMGAAIGLYSSLGFKKIAPYRENPVEGALFFELDLSV